ncbi:unnamed protein product [Amoebophrya sp. A120]|nr:unnamed protein product [Amoebophrya sp. A120]|eukprot:GSA120T00024930001.1
MAILESVALEEMAVELTQLALAIMGALARGKYDENLLPALRAGEGTIAEQNHTRVCGAATQTLHPDQPPKRGLWRPASTCSSTYTEPVAAAACSRQPVALRPPAASQRPTTAYARAERPSALSRHKRRHHHAGPHALPTRGEP